jgi:hypothetical protein
MGRLESTFVDQNNPTQSLADAEHTAREKPLREYMLTRHAPGGPGATGRSRRLRIRSS